MTPNERRTVAAIRATTGLTHAEAMQLLRRCTAAGIPWESAALAKRIEQSRALDVARERSVEESERE